MYCRPIRLVKICLLTLCFSICLYEISIFLYKSKRTGIISTKTNSTEQFSLKSSKEFQEIFEKLSPFTVHLPKFFDEEAKNWFYNCTYYKINSKKCPEKNCEKNGVLFNDPKEHLDVHLAFVRNGLYMNEDCGYNYDNQAMRRVFENEKDIPAVYDTAFIYTVPDGWAFQHFLDGIGPKLSHSFTFLNKYPDAKVVILRGSRFDRSVKEIWEMLGVPEFSRIIHHSGGSRIGARLLINPCRTPDPNHIKYRIELFYNARYIIGVHSGALSNMNFAQSGTTLIEIMPYRSGTSSLPMTCSMFNPLDLKACAGYILYTQSQLLNQTYWILPTVVNNDGNMNVNLSRVENLLQQI
ncbi:unnamed protein product [Adineta ricciae]|uniref:Uncharacterized protein n=1 Tax=Adineta ricciae TaxID=249248 RepID=A0A815TT30_ADIRI|nr:unnamed protein product [Adineta ricciae]CAF1649558.1 unnamed protein product [Adineta ricciae]